ncbi:MAG TPA: zf-TFIIB domain-containing protein [Candidatus Sumerlaeota bacterium]|nr:zf-TFIIB domain-containing protein [Candidatus Sumerlaeota bacterium]HPS01317.1 zf-TFIIB domain-containing protein [Candidatus Sumerlaeota bacterium]
MKCPVCREQMVVLEYDAVEVDYCLICGGVWLDAGELELLFSDEQEGRDFLARRGPSYSGNEKPHPCPICGKKMTKELVAGETSVLYDHCPQGDGLWFDRGELATILRQSGALSNVTVSDFLKDLFGSETGGMMSPPTSQS